MKFQLCLTVTKKKFYTSDVANRPWLELRTSFFETSRQQSLDGKEKVMLDKGDHVRQLP